MPTFRIRYKIGQGPADVDADDAIVVEAEMFQTSGDFIDFYASASQNIAGGLNPKGGIIFRVHTDVIADIRQNLSNPLRSPRF